jgi:hypothetical protein
MNSIISSIRFFPANYNRYEFNTGAIMDKQMVAKQGADQIPTATPIPKYAIDFYDMIDGWCHMVDHKENQFATWEEAARARDKENEELAQGNKDCGEHYSVIDLENLRVVDAPPQQPIQNPYESWLQNQADEVGKTLDLNRGSLALDGYQNFALDIAELIRRINIGEQGYLDEQTRIASERPGREE